jgi:hypothetical protein
MFLPEQQSTLERPCGSASNDFYSGLKIVAGAIVYIGNERSWDSLAIARN